MNLKPDMLNGQKIFRGVDTCGDGVNHQNRSIVFPPKVVIGAVPVLPLDELVEQSLSRIIRISDQTGDPLIKAQAVAFRGNLKLALMSLAKRVEAQSRG
jgi:hypothetical protein